MIAALKANKIIWPEEEYNDPNSQIFIISVDGTDFKVWESKHPMMPYDKGQFSHKFNHMALSNTRSLSTSIDPKLYGLVGLIEPDCMTRRFLLRRV